MSIWNAGSTYSSVHYGDRTGQYTIGKEQPIHKKTAGSFISIPVKLLRIDYSKLNTNLLPRAAAALSIIFKVGELWGFSRRLTEGHEVSRVRARSASDLLSHTLEGFTTGMNGGMPHKKKGF